MGKSKNIMCHFINRPVCFNDTYEPTLYVQVLFRNKHRCAYWHYFVSYHSGALGARLLVIAIRCVYSLHIHKHIYRDSDQLSYNSNHTELGRVGRDSFTLKDFVLTAALCLLKLHIGFTHCGLGRSL